jgi:hypothetical protein
MREADELVKPSETMNARYPAAVGGCRCHCNLKTNPKGAFNTPRGCLWSLIGSVEGYDPRKS